MLYSKRCGEEVSDTMLHFVQVVLAKERNVRRDELFRHFYVISINQDSQSLRPYQIYLFLAVAYPDRCWWRRHTEIEPKRKTK